MDLGNGVVFLRAGAGLDFGTLRPGDRILVGIAGGESGARAVYVRGSAGTAAADPALAGSVASGTLTIAPAAARRPVHVIPNPGAPRSAAATAVAVADEADAPLGAGKSVASFTLVGTPAEPTNEIAVADPHPDAAPQEPAAIDIARENGRQQLAAGLDALDVLVREVDRAWALYAHTCPAAGSTAARGWLSLPADTVAAPGLCGDLLANVQRSSSMVRERLADLENAARASSVTPGTVRALLESHQLAR